MGDFRPSGDHLQVSTFIGTLPRENTLLDFEAKSNFEVSVQVEDITTGISDSLTYTLTVSDVDEVPTSSTPSRIDRLEDTAPSTVDLSSWFADPDIYDWSLDYSVQNIPSAWLNHSITEQYLTLGTSLNSNGTT